MKQAENLLDKIKSLPARDKAAIAIGLAVSFIILGYIYVYEPAKEQYEERQMELSLLAERVSRYRAVVNTTDENRERNKHYADRFEQMLKRCLKGNTADIAAGKLSKIARDIATKSGISINQVKIERHKKLSGFMEVAVTISFESSLANISAFIKNIEESQERVAIRKVKMHSKSETYGDNQPETLSVQLQLNGLAYLP